MDLENKKGINIEEINGIKNDMHLSPIEAKADLTETINNTYKDAIQPVAQKVGKGLVFCFEFLASTIKPYMYEKIEEAKYKCKEIDKKLEEKYNKTPVENRTMPRTCIIGPALDVLKYNLDEEHIKEIFINILTNEMDTRNQSKVLPAYINIVNQLSKLDAEFLKIFKTYNTNFFCTINLESNIKGSLGTQKLYKFIICTDKKNNISKKSILYDIILDNLSRLNIIRVKYGEYYPDKNEEYSSLEKYIMNIPLTKILMQERPNNEFKCKKGVLELTQFGKNFIDICLS